MSMHSKSIEGREDEAFLRHLILPEEDCLHYRQAAPWTGGCRWFRSENVVCIEHYRRPPPLLSGRPCDRR
jgi:hypothetical protein